MIIDESTRLDLRAYFRQAMGDPRLADALMEAIPPLDYTELATKNDLLLSSAELKSEMAELKGDLRSEMAELRTDLRSEMAELRGDFGLLRGDVKAELSGFERAVNSQMRTMMTFIVGSTLTTWGLIVTLFVAGGA